MSWIYRLFNYDKIDELQRVIDIYKERNEQLEREVREHKGYKLKYEVTKLYVEDDEALLELFELKKSESISKAQWESVKRQGNMGGMGNGSIGLGLAGFGVRL